jgi:hypothetical protein
MTEPELEAPLGNTITRTEPCPECRAGAIWTQNAWPEAGAGEARAAYRCLNGHVIDPDTTRQCPACGVHDTLLRGSVEGRQQFTCARCGEAFTYPR